jgi:hypothetical protein
MRTILFSIENAPENGGTNEMDNVLHVYYTFRPQGNIPLFFSSQARYERIIEDPVGFCEQLRLTDEGGADREEAYRRSTGNFETGQTIEIAEKTKI